jgi:hypothetical protein
MSRDARRLAGDPATDPAVLSRLAGGEDEGVRRLVALNPNTPLETLLKLFATCPEEVQRNPALPLYLLTDPAALFAMAVTVRYELAGAPLSLTPLVLETLASDPATTVRRRLAGDPRCPPAALVRLAGDPEPQVRHVVLRNKAAGPEALAALARATRAMPPGDERDEFEALHPSTTPAALAALAASGHVGVRRAVASHPSTPTTTLVALAECAEASVRQRVAYHPGAPPALLARLASDRDPYVRGAVASNEATPLSYLLVLSRDAVGDVRSACHSNARLERHLVDRARSSAEPAELAELAALFAAPVNVRALVAVAENLATPPEAFESLADLVPDRAASHPSLPPHLIERLAVHDHPAVRAAVARRDALAPAPARALARDPDDGVRGAIARRTADVALLKRLARDRAAAVRGQAAANPHLPGRVRERLAVDPDERVRAAAAGGPGLGGRPRE